MARNLLILTALAGTVALMPAAHAQPFSCEERSPAPAVTATAANPDAIVLPTDPQPDPMELRTLKYAALKTRHRLDGLASYYSRSLDGTLTATGEIFRNSRLTAAHLTLPLGTWIEVRARATGKKIRCRVNDRGPYVKKFVLDLSKAAAHALGVDIAEDRYVDIRVIALPGEEPLPDGWDIGIIPPPMDGLPDTGVATAQ